MGLLRSIRAGNHVGLENTEIFFYVMLILFLPFHLPFPFQSVCFYCYFSFFGHELRRRDEGDVKARKSYQRMVDEMMQRWG